MTVWFVTGASRGFGLEIAREALARGHQVVATARRADGIRAQLPEAAEGLLTVDLDVTDQGSVAAAVEAAVGRFGRLDVVVNNAGRGVLGAVEEVSDDAARAVFDVNVFGTLNVQRAVLPVLRRQRSGHVINISSIGGVVGMPGWGVHCATKFTCCSVPTAWGSPAPSSRPSSTSWRHGTRCRPPPTTRRNFPVQRASWVRSVGVEPVLAPPAGRSSPT